MKRFFLMLIVLVGISQYIGCDATSEVGVEEHHSVEITTSNFEEVVLNSDKPVMLDFWATWCGPCVQLTPTVEGLAKDYDGKVIVGKVNVDEQEALAAKYEIQTIPRILYFKNGELVKQTDGKSKSEMKADIEEVMNL